MPLLTTLSDSTPTFADSLPISAIMFPLSYSLCSLGFLVWASAPTGMFTLLFLASQSEPSVSESINPGSETWVFLCNADIPRDTNKGQGEGKSKYPPYFWFEYLYVYLTPVSNTPRGTWSQVTPSSRDRFICSNAIFIFTCATMHCPPASS